MNATERLTATVTSSGAVVRSCRCENMKREEGRREDPRSIANSECAAIVDPPPSFMRSPRTLRRPPRPRADCGYSPASQPVTKGWAYKTSPETRKPSLPPVKLL